MVEVSDGYARNFLLRKNLAVEATQQNINNAEAKAKAEKHRQGVLLAAGQRAGGKIGRPAGDAESENRRNG